MSVAAACELARVSRAGFYRHWGEHEPLEAEMELRHRVQQIVLEEENRKYGYRRVSRQLRREGWVVNHKRVLRLMRQDNLLCVRRRRFVLTTDSSHFWPVYPNLAAERIVETINQLWVADITYIRLLEQFVYLAVILDAFSRKVIGWELAETLAARLALGALERALAERGAPPGLMHHSDRGVQYCCREYVSLLESHGILISMSRRGNPYDNAQAESFIKTLKCEEVYLRDYRTIEEARESIGSFIEQVYNEKRLHSALDYRPPAEFEAALANSPAVVQPGKVRYEFSQA
jgi:transposase InsO family protein